MERLFDSFFREPLAAMDWPRWGSDKWSPAVDLAENDKELTVRAELPGIDPKDLDVTVTGNQLVLSGEKKESSEHKEKDFYHSETRYGSFRRTVAFARGNRYGERRCPVRQRRVDVASAENRARCGEAHRGQGKVVLVPDYADGSFRGGQAR